MGVTRMGGSLYVLGGYFGQPHNYSKEFQSGEFMRLDVATGKWQELPPIQGLQSVALVNDGRYLYRVGGMRALNAAGEPENLQSVKEVARFDPVARTWTALPDLPEPRSSHQALIAPRTSGPRSPRDSRWLPPSTCARSRFTMNCCCTARSTRASRASWR
jgi:hypothetical protein